MGLFPKAAQFLGIDKFGQGLAAAGRFFSGSVGQDIQAQQDADASVQKLMYVAKQEQDPDKKRRLLEMTSRLMNPALRPEATQIDPGLNLSDREVIGSAANVGLNTLAPGAFKGGAVSTIAKNAALGAGFGMASGYEKNRDIKGIAGSTLGGAIVGSAIGVTGVAAKAFKDFLGQKIPVWMMNKAVKPALADLRKNVKFGTKTLGEELLNEGVKGGPKRLLEIADEKLTTLEDELQTVLTSPTLSEARITRQQIKPYLKDLIAAKKGVPGLGGEAQRVEGVWKSMPEQMTLIEANQMKRRIYQELRDVAYKMDAKLNTRATALKQIARGLKTEIENTVGGTVVSDINRKLSIYGRLENAMVDQLAKEMRNNGISLTDAVLLAGGDTTSILALLRHIGQGSETAVAQALSKVQKVGTGKVGRTVKSTLKRGALNAP